MDHQLYKHRVPSSFTAAQMWCDDRCRKLSNKWTPSECCFAHKRKNRIVLKKVSLYWEDSCVTEMAMLDENCCWELGRTARRCSHLLSQQHLCLQLMTGAKITVAEKVIEITLCCRCPAWFGIFPHIFFCLCIKALKCGRWDETYKTHPVLASW